jgi:hypothetical protein
LSLTSREPAADAVAALYPASIAASLLGLPAITASANRLFLAVKAINKNLKKGKILRVRELSVSGWCK